MRRTGDMPNVPLTAHAAASMQTLEEARSRMVRGEIHNMLDDEVFGRAGVVSRYLSAAQILREGTRYSESLALCRSALEAAICDVLTFRHDQLVSYIEFASKSDAETWLSGAFANRDADSGLEYAALHNGRYCKSGCVELVQRTVLKKEDGTNETLPAARHLYTERTDVFARKRQLFRSTRYPHGDEDEYQRTTANFTIHHMTYAAVKLQLLRLGSLDDIGAELLQHHFDYLSNFVHPQRDPAELLWPLDYRMGQGGRDSWVERMILLYSAAAADLELESLAAYVSTRNSLAHPPLTTWLDDAARARRSSDVRSELRFPWAPEHPVDVYTEQVWDEFRRRDAQRNTPADLRWAGDDRPYLEPNVLSRIHRIHTGENELMSRSYYGPTPSSITDK